MTSRGRKQLRITLDDHGNAVIERFAKEKKKEEIVSGWQ
jgi:hypothetical protein